MLYFLFSTTNPRDPCVQPVAAPDTMVQIPEKDDPLYYRLLKYTLHLLTIAQMVKLVACRGIMWTHIFASFYLIHWALAILQQVIIGRLADPTKYVVNLELRRRLSRGIFQAAAHALICLVTFSWIEFRSHLLLVVGGVILACAWGTVKFESTESLPFMAALCHFIVLVEVFFLINPPFSPSLHNESTLKSTVMAFNIMCFLVTLILGTSRLPSKVFGYVFCFFNLLFTFFPYMLFWRSSHSYKPAWTRFLG